MIESSSALFFFEFTESFKHDYTSKKAAVLDTISYLHDHHIHIQKEEVFHYFDVPPQTRFCWLAKNEPHRLHNHPDSGPDLCSQKRKLTHEDL